MVAFVQNRRADIPLEPTNSFYFSALELQRHGVTAEARVGELVAASEALLVDPSESSLIETLIGAAKALKIDTETFAVGFEHTQLASRDSLETTPQLRVQPGSVLLASRSQVTIDVDLNLPRSGAFTAELVLESSAPAYLIPLSAQASTTQLQFEDPSPLDLGRVALGQLTSATRWLSNGGDLPVSFRVVQTNAGLQVAPAEGTVAAGKRLQLTFSFFPVDEQWRRNPVLVVPDNSNRFGLNFSAAGGLPRLTVNAGKPHGARVDFGRCLVRQSELQRVCLGNSGNALLEVVDVRLERSVAFYASGPDDPVLQPLAHSADPATASLFEAKERSRPGSTRETEAAPLAAWPLGSFALMPGAQRELGVVFRPPTEDFFLGRLLIDTPLQTFSVELQGQGRQAMLVYDRSPLVFSECLLGNSYTRELALVNVGSTSFTTRLAVLAPNHPFLCRSRREE
jgi:hypothetical protein